MDETPKHDGYPKDGDAPQAELQLASKTGDILQNHEISSKSIIPQTRRKDDSIRMVTPEPTNSTAGETGPWMSDIEASLQASPRSILGGEKSWERRHGLVFEDAFETGEAQTQQQNALNDSDFEESVSQLPNTRPRNRTIDGAQQQRHPSGALPVRRHRTGSNYSALGSSDENATKEEPGPYISKAPAAFRSVQAQRADSINKQPPGGGRLVKRSNPSSRSTSPAPLPAYVDTLPVPIATRDAIKVLKLMNGLNGRMKGEVEYQTSGHGSWAEGICYIDDKGTFLLEGTESSPYNQTIVTDLRGCRVKPPIDEKERNTLDISVASGMRLRLRPLDASQYDYWLAALLSWQQKQNGSSQNSAASSEAGELRSLSRRPSFTQTKDVNIIKVGRVFVWDKGTSHADKSEIRGAQRANRSWRKVSCTLQDNGEFKLMTENDVSLLATIQLSQLSRCAIQQLDRTVLNQEYCVAIFPQYTAAATSISIITPIYISLESRVLFEVWYVLLRIFTVPEIYGSRFSAKSLDEPNTLESLVISTPDDLFRIEKTLSIRIIEAKLRPTGKKPEPPSDKRHGNKPEPDGSVGDYFAEVVLDGEVRSRTTTKFGTAKPFWREESEFSALPAALPEVSIALKRMIPRPHPHNHGSKSAVSASPEVVSEVLCGIVHIRMDQLDRGKDVENWWPVLNEKKEVIGEMLVKVRHDELVVLLLKDYQPLSELLHKFNLGLTLQMSQLVPSKLRFLAETLLDVFQVSGQVSQWLVSLVEDEIDGISKETPVQRLRFSRRMGSNDSFESVSEREVTVRDMNKSLTGEANLLFRGNSLLTQALDFHMRRVGREYLEELLGDKVREINAMVPDCEVDPSRIGPGEDINKNWVTLNALTTDVWAHISTSHNQCPSELRQILKYIRTVAEDRYGNVLRTAPYTSVSGFLFLRFFCPSLLNPKLFGLLRDHPHPKAQRTLTLIAKSLQVLANLSTFGQKEAWMEPMNRFLALNRNAVRTFIDNICSIPSDRTRIVTPASYSTPLTILKRLPMISREGFPSLPYLIDDARTFAALIRFWLESVSSDSARIAEFSGDLLVFHNQCVAVQKRADECLRRAEAEAKAEDPPELQWEDILRSLERSSAIDQRTFTENDLVPHNSYPHAPPSRGRWNDDGGAPGSAGSESESRERRERQTFWESTFGKESGRGAATRPTAADVFNLDGSASSPPVDRGGSREGKGGKGGFLSVLRKKEKSGEKEKDKDKDREREKEREREREKDRSKLEKEARKEEERERREAEREVRRERNRLMRDRYQQEIEDKEREKSERETARAAREAREMRDASE